MHEGILERLTNVRSWEQSGVRAPHKPLLLLIALARLQQGKPREMRFAEVEPKLVELLRKFGPPRGTEEPHLPFWHLKNDGGIWGVHSGESIQSPRTGKPMRAAMREHAVGGLAPGVEETLRLNPEIAT